MEDGDHSKCVVELLACPDHMEEQLRRMGYEPGTSNMPRRSEGAAGGNFFKDGDGNRTIGFCLWCNKDVFQQLTEQHCMPPVLQRMFENAGILDEDNGGNEPEKTDE